MKALSKFALFTALVVLSACSVAEAPFKVYADKDKSFKQMEKFLAGGSTKWENVETRTNQDADGKDYEVKSYSRIYTYDDENFAFASFENDKENGASSHYTTFTHKKLSVDGWTATYNDGSADKPVDVTGYTIYELTQGPGGSASTTSPRAARKEYYIIKISGSSLSAFTGGDADATAKTFKFYNSTAPTAAIYKKL